VVLGLVTAACGSGGARLRSAAPPSTPAATSTTAPGPPTSPAASPYGVFALTGLPVHDPALAHRPALSVKVDNAGPALPQSGLNAADIVTEALVEGGLTRLLATYQSQDADRVGPIRSVRPVDADLLDELNGGIFAFSGGAAGEIAPARGHSGAVLIDDDAGNGGFARSADRRAPYNLFGSTAAFYVEGARVARKSPPAPPQLFQYSWPAPTTTAASGVQLTWSIYRSAGWTWDPASTSYQRNQDGAPDTLADGSRVTATDVVIMSTPIRGTGIFDAAHKEDPFVVVTGQGDCWLLRDGVLIKGRWVRPSTYVPVKLLDDAGNALALKPGRTWVELLPLGLHPTFS
jgi:hypothetical protein